MEHFQEIKRTLTIRTEGDCCDPKCDGRISPNRIEFNDKLTKHSIIYPDTYCAIFKHKLDRTLVNKYLCRCDECLELRKETPND
jgi:hypothetical protein